MTTEKDNMKEERMTIAKRLREAREYLGFSQKDVAEHLGLHRETVSEFEAGRRKVSVEELKKLSALYNRSVGYLTGENTEVTLDKRTEELLIKASDLPDSDIEEVIRFAEFLKTRKKQKRP